MHQYIFTYLNQKYGLKVDLYYSVRILLFRQLPVLSRGYRRIRKRIMMFVSLARFWGIRLMRSLGLYRRSWRPLLPICWKCILRPKCPIKVQLKSMIYFRRKWTISSSGKSHRTSSSTYTTKTTPTPSSRNWTSCSNFPRNQKTKPAG